MLTQPYQLGRKTCISRCIDDILDALLAEPPDGRRRAITARIALHRPCDGCGGEAPEVDLWAEDSETGEQLWLCPSCGDS